MNIFMIIIIIIFFAFAFVFVFVFVVANASYIVDYAVRVGCWVQVHDRKG